VFSARPVTGSAEERVFELNHVAQPRTLFLQRLRTVLSIRRDRSIEVCADGAKAFQDVVALIDLVLEAGGQVVLTTAADQRDAPLPPPPPPPPPPPE
jgi:biopolymer transport protein ExbD